MPLTAGLQQAEGEKEGKDAAHLQSIAQIPSSQEVGGSIM
jgi:hypothetical protein